MYLRLGQYSKPWSAISSCPERYGKGNDWCVLATHRTNEWVSSTTKVREVMHITKARKWTWAVYIGGLQNNRWTSQVTD